MSQSSPTSALLSGEVERLLAGLTFPLRHAVRSRVLGQHRSPLAGSSIEFSEHKEYSPGDDLRRVNWKAYGRLDRFYIKQTIQEASAAAVIFLDTSASMASAGDEGVPKLRCAAELAAALAWVLLHQGDQVGMLSADGAGGFEWISPHRHPSHYHRLVGAMADMVAPAGRLDREVRGVPAALAEGLRLADIERWHDATLLVISDFLFPFDELLTALDRLRHRNNRAWLFHVIHPEEYAPTLEGGVPDWSRPARGSFPYKDICRFRSPETGVSVRADPRMVRREYLSRFKEFLGELRRRAAGSGITYMPISTAEPADRFLVRTLRGG